MPGHNGGYNPYRDQNGEYATAERAGKPGRSRKRGRSTPLPVATWPKKPVTPRIAKPTAKGRPPAPKVVAGKWNTKTQRENPYRETQFWSDNTGHREGLSSSQVSYRGKGQNIYGVKKTSS